MTTESTAYVDLHYRACRPVRGSVLSINKLQHMDQTTR